MSRIRVLVIGFVVACLVAAPAVSPAAGPTITGAGSTFSEVAIKQWVGDVANQGLSVNYSGVGSTQGRQQYINNKQNIDFAVSEIPFEASEVGELNQKGLSYQYLPIVAGGTSLMYHVKDTSGARINGLQLSGSAAAKIFTGQIKKWNDPEIVAENGDIQLPDKAIKPVVRSDGSGTSAQFSAYLIKMFPSVVGNFFNGAPNASIWPEFPGYVAQQRSDGVANFVAGNENSITYVEAAFAEQRRFPVVLMKNAAGKYTKPDSGNVALALEKATFNQDRTQNLDGVYTHPSPDAYPISSYSYMISPTKPADITAAEGEVLGKFMIYFACRGQRSADALGYSPLPRNLVEGVFEAVRAIPGAPAPPALNPQDCPNPTITGETKPPTKGEDPAPANNNATSTTAPAGGGGGTNNDSSGTTAPGGGGGSSNNPTDTTGPGGGGGDSSGATSPGGTSNPAGGGTGTKAAGTTAKKPAAGTKTATPKTAGTKTASPKAGASPKASGSAQSGQSTQSGSSDETEADLDLGSIEPGDSSELGQRLVDLETRVSELEARAFGTAEADAALDPELRDELLAAAQKVESRQQTGGPLGIVVLTVIVFAPFFAAAARRLSGRWRHTQT